MSITSKEAAAVAKKFGLNLSDTAALASLAGSTEEAEELAKQFQPEPDANQIADRIIKSKHGGL